MERERSSREYDRGERDTRDRERDRERDRDRERSSRSGRDRDHEKESRDKARDRETSTSPKTRERERERHREIREREKNRDRDRERDSRDRDNYDRPRERDSRDRERDRDRDRERDRDRDRERERDRDREARDRPSSSSGVAFSRPATYDPRLAQRTQLRNQRGSNGYDDDDDLRYEDTVRRKQLKDELGLSDDDQDTLGDGSDEDGAHERNGKSKGTRNGAGGGAGNSNREMLEQLEKLQRELEIARENEQKAHDSLSNLQLLSKSQTAILKTTMTKKIQEKQDVLEEMTGTIKDLEAKLYTAGIEFEAYSAPLVKASSSSSSSSSSTATGGSSASEADAIAEIGAMKSEIDRLMDENKMLKAAAAAATASAANGKAAVASSAKESSPKKEDQVSKAKLAAVEAEKCTLAQQLKETQQKLADLKAVAPPTAQLSAPPAPPAESSSNVEELRALQKKVRSVDLALLSLLSMLRALVLILCFVPC